MKFKKLFPPAPIQGVANRAALLALCLVVFGAAASAKNVSTVKPSPATPAARPVARLITSNDTPSAAARPRPRLVASTRPAATLIDAYSAAPPAALTYTAAPVAATDDERRVFELINARRQERGLQSLTWDGGLIHIARLHSENMASQDFFDHVGRDGLSAAGRAGEAGIRGWHALGENIAYNQGFADPAAFAVERWMNSAKHRENILSAAYTHTGLGVARAADGRIYFTQVFMTR